MEGTNEPTTKEILQEAVRTTEQTTEATKRSLMVTISRFVRDGRRLGGTDWFVMVESLLWCGRYFQETPVVSTSLSTRE